MTRLFAGIDVGTSGVRAIAIDAAGAVHGQASRPMPAPVQAGGALVQDPAIWWDAVDGCLQALANILPARSIAAIAVDGTSGTLLLADAASTPLAPATMYNDGSAAALAPKIREIAPPESGAHGASSPLARLLAAQPHHPGAVHALHQADWIAGRLLGAFGRTDDNNALKLGFDPVTRTWPGWMDALGVRRELLPAVVPPGTAFGPAARPHVARYGLAEGCVVVAGTTDGCASFLATGADTFGDAVTSLGSTLTVKLLSDRPVFAPAYGVYSHRLGDRWLVGGASNSGGAALLRFFTAARMGELTPLLRPDLPTGYSWHPLPARGERFPVADPAMGFEPDPRPADDALFFQALLEGIADVEARAYRLLVELGAPPLRSLRTVGGGAANPVWTQLRAERLKVPMPAPTHLEAAYGTALLARRGAAA
ncbi:MAG: FGGY-family carbohydrate kinase [Geminicoccaceae bacterium]